MPGLDQTHQHSALDIMSADDPHTPISESGATPTLAEVLVAGNDAGDNSIAMPFGSLNGTTGNGELDLLGADGVGAEGAIVAVAAGNGDTGFAGGELVLQGGDGNGDDGGRVSVHAGSGSGAAAGAFFALYGAGGDGSGGRVSLVSGPADVNMNGGEIRIESGYAISNGNGGDIILAAGTGDGAGRNGLIFLNLPTSDPGVAGALYSDGVPSAGVPKPLMVSGG